MKKKQKQQRDAELNEINQLKEKTKAPGEFQNASLFSDLPLSNRTKMGLKKAGYKKMTEIQQQSLPLSLCSRDILGAAKTGSGKTLAFIIPVVEKLYKECWTPLDGLGALLISPTRELAIQIFEVLKKVGEFHGFSAGLVIGGKSLEEEKKRIFRMNILVATPGRLLQHLDQTVGFDVSHVQILVLDEADRCLDMGFSKTLNAILGHLSTERQTLLFSATQTKSVKDLARLSLKKPEYVSVHEKSQYATPNKLQQHYMVSELPQKLDLLFSFIKTHLHCKALVFISSCKQVRFIHETFCRLQPGVPLLCLHGKQKQSKRMDIYYDFCEKKHAFLFATDIAARGLDFASVDWVIQLDCPEDVETYIHRVGRTARYQSQGKSLLMLNPSEEPGMIKILENKNIPIKKLLVNAKKTMSISKQLAAFCTQDPELKYLGQKAFVSYVRSIYLQSNKEVFSIDNLPLDDYAASLGLPGTPKIKFVTTNKKNECRDLINQEPKKEDQPKTRVDKMFQRRNLDVLSEHYNKLRQNEEENDDDIFTLKRVDHSIEEVKIPNNEPLEMSRRDILKTKKKHLLKKEKNNLHVVFDEDGQETNLLALENEKEFINQRPMEERILERLDEAQNEMSIKDIEDKEIAKQKRREKKWEKKQKEKKKRGEDVQVAVQLNNNQDSYNDDEASEDDEEEEISQGDKDEDISSNEDVSDDELNTLKRKLVDDEELAMSLIQSKRQKY
ncbi:DEAD-domain-containing protein [Rozella allomycis CSF55]|uniref:ATP-dependent RNA helicase n=1 Tax=Rozella allomycis (strain CSF55) TaxID=988480 RepID=A0A4P9YHD8_ROZAC|nr:DEAD-domain-containing protein [Rozella allomycis CSF55]